MRSIVRAVTITGLIAASVSALAAQPGRRPVRPLPPEPPARAQVRERMLDRREAMLERREAMREGMRIGARMGGRAGFRAGVGAGMRGGRPGLRGPGGPGGRMGRGMAGERADRRAVVRQRIDALKPAEREAMFKYRQSLSEERFRATEELRAGKINREQLRERLTKWRDSHKPPVDLRKPPEKN